MKDDFFASIGSATLVILGIVLIVSCILLIASLRPVLLSIEREANQQSQQYVESTQTHLYLLARKYDDLQETIDRLKGDESNQEVIAGMIARQKAILVEMEEEADRIPASEVPGKVKQLLAEERKVK